MPRPRIGFSHAAFVWHYRRSTVKAYFKQQAGWRSQALLAANVLNVSTPLAGHLAGTSVLGQRQSPVARTVIYHGVFGSGFFQRLYAPAPFQPLMLCSSLAYHACVNLPLVILSVYLRSLWPVAVTSLILSFGVCTMAAAQARLLREHSRWWSRPLVAFLFFAQPIVRGWSRIRSRLMFSAARQPASLAPPVRSNSDTEADLLCYWAKGETDRYTVLSRLAENLAQTGWSRRPDTGWRTHDFEVAANRCARLQLTTVTEELELGRRSFRVRLQSGWSTPAMVAFWMASAAVAALIGFLAESTPWIWMTVVLLPILHGWFEGERRSLHAATAAISDAVASDLKLVKLTRKPGTTSQ
jgi:hypothetical protein